MISVIVCTYNRCESLRDTLEALSAQVVRNGLQLEVVVVDNNSTDQTKQMVEVMARQVRWPVRYVFERQQGQSYARNLGIQEARGECIAFTDDDVLPEPQWAQALYEAFVTYDSDCVGGKVLPRWLQIPPPWLLSEELEKQVWGVLALLDRGPQVIIGDAGDRNLLYGANMAFRKTVFSEVGLFRTDLGPIGTVCSRGDDTNMLERLLTAGKRVVYTPDAVVHHKVAPERMRLSYFRRWAFHSGRSTTRMAQPGTYRIPLWLFRECGENALGVLWAYGHKPFCRYSRELLFWHGLGRITEFIKLPWQSQS